MFGTATNTNKFCTATGGPVLARGEHVTGGLVAAAARGLLAVHGWVGGPRGRFMNSLGLRIVLSRSKKSISRFWRIFTF